MAGITIGYFEYPDALKDRTWQKNKGILAKAKKTGIGDLLKAAEAMYGKLDFAAIDPRTKNPSSQAELDKLVAACKAAYKADFVPFTNHLDKIVAHAGKVEKDNSALLKGAKSGIRQVIDAAKGLRMTFKSLDLEAATKVAQAQMERRQALATEFLRASLKKFAEGAGALLKDPTPSSWDKNIKQQGRSVSNSVKDLRAYNARFWKDFIKFQGFDVGTLGLAKMGEAEFARESTALVKEAIKQVKAIAAFKP